MNRLQKTALGISGITSLGIGASILAAPHAFYASYGITPGSDPNLLSELRATGAGLGVLGVIMLFGVFRKTPSQTAIVAALTVFLAFPAGRAVSMVADGMPSSGIMGALAFELGLAALCLFAFRPGTNRALQASTGH